VVSQALATVGKHVIVHVQLHSSSQYYVQHTAWLVTYLIINKYDLPGMPAHNPDPRTTDDKFVMEIRLSDNATFSSSDLHAKIKETDIIEIEEKDYVVVK
jgi:hypothetical protein